MGKNRNIRRALVVMISGFVVAGTGTVATAQEIMPFGLILKNSAGTIKAGGADKTPAGKDIGGKSGGGKETGGKSGGGGREAMPNGGQAHGGPAGRGGGGRV